MPLTVVTRTLSSVPLSVFLPAPIEPLFPAAESVEVVVALTHELEVKFTIVTKPEITYEELPIP